MLTDQDIKILIDVKTETPNRDYKETMIWSRTNRDKCLDIIKDILAMSNTQDGGKIIFGVRDSDFEFIGLSDEAYQSFDATPINQLLHNYADPAHTCSVVKAEIEGKKTVVIDVSEFSEVPIICKISANSRQNVEVLKKGAVYIRTSDCTSEPINRADEMRSILAIGLTKKSDELLGVIQKLITGKPIAEKPQDKQLYEEEITEAQTFFDSKIASEAGYWEVIAYPNSYKPELIANPVDVGDIVNNSIVHLRGWDFPHVDNHEHASNFNKGKQSFTDSDTVQVKEAWRMHKSGLLVWKQYFREDLRGFDEEGRKVLFFVSSIYAVTEYMLFFKRVYSEILDSDTVHINLSLFGCRDRMLASSPGTLLGGSYISNEDQITIEKNVKAVDLRASFESVARIFIREIFMLFNWNNPDESMLESWQKKLIEQGG